MVDAQRFRTVWFIEGVRVPDPLIVADVAIIPFPSVAVTRYLAQLLEHPLQELGFATDFNGPALIASGSASRPVVGLVMEAETTNVGEVLDLFRTLGDQIRTALVFVYGGEARLLAQVVETSDDGGISWRPLSFANGGPGSIRSELAALAPDGWSPPTPSLAEAMDSFRRRPLVGLWCTLFSSAVGEPRWDVRILRLWSVLETIAKRAIPKGSPVVDANGTQLTTHDGMTPKAKDARGAVYLLLQRTRELLPVPDEIALCHPDHELWDEVDVWLTIRNGVAHDGTWPSPNSKPASVARVAVSIDRAAREGGTVDEGLDRYARHLKAWVEAVLAAAALGHLDAALAAGSGTTDLEDSSC